MKLLSFSLAALLLTASSAAAQWRVSTGYAPMFGIKAEFSGFGNFNNPFPTVPAPGPAQNYFYLDGSVQVDSSGNALGVTSNFSYQNNAQYDPAANGGLGAINFTALASGLNNAGTASESNIAAAAGFNLSGFYTLGTVAFIPAVDGRAATWGLRVGAQYNRVDVHNTESVTSGIGTINDAFSTGGLIPPLAPYTGSFFGPGFLLGDTPTRTFGTTTATISGSRKLDVHILASQIGTYLEIPVAPKFDVMLEGGLIVALASGNYRYQSSVTVPGTPTQDSEGNKSSTKLLPGFYTGVAVTYNVTETFGIQAGLRYQYLKQFDLGANGSNAALSFSSAFVASLSAVWKF